MQKPIPQDILEWGDRLKLRRAYLLILWKDEKDEEKVRSRLRYIEQARLVRTTTLKHWKPQLLEHEAKCRAERPIPAFEDLNLSEREEYRVFQAAMKKPIVAEIPANADIPIITHSSPAGLLAAKEAFGEDARNVYLLTSEKEDWFENNYEMPLNEFGREIDWYGVRWWTIYKKELPKKIRDEFNFPQWLLDDFTREEYEGTAGYFLDNLPKTTGSEYWFLTYGWEWNRHHYEIWTYDGTQAQFYEDLGVRVIS